LQIYTVMQGDSLYSIANEFGVTYENIANANEMDVNANLVVGQSLVIPTYGHFYTVQSGDTLYNISQQYGISTAELAKINQINLYQPLPVGLRLYIPETQKRDIEVNAYIEPFGGTVSERLEEAARKHAENLTYLAPSSYRVDIEGNLTAPPLNEFPTIATEHGTTLMLVITNLAEGAFSAEIAQAVL